MSRYRQRYLEHYTRVGMVIVEGALWRGGEGLDLGFDAERLWHQLKAMSYVTGNWVIWPQSVWDAYLNFYGPPPKWLVWLIGRTCIKVVPDEEFICDER